MSSDCDDQSWRDWLDRYGPALLLLARQHLRSHSDADDAVQDGFVRFWRSRDRARDAKAYLFACVRSAAIDLSRGRRRREQYEQLATEIEGNDRLFERLEQEELRESVQTALAQLPAEQREVLVMKIWGELTFEQIAVALQVPMSTAASRYRYALSRLHETLKQEANHE